MGTDRQTVRLQPEDEQIEQRHLAYAFHHFAAQTESTPGYEEGLRRTGRGTLLHASSIRFGGIGKAYADRSRANGSEGCGEWDEWIESSGG